MLPSSTRWVAGAVSCALLSGSLGCSSSYIPVKGPRLSLTMENGGLAYIRDGKKFDGGFLGGDIEEAVAGNPVAEEYARDYKNGLTGGFAATLLGAAALVGGGTLTGIQTQPDNGGVSHFNATGPVIAGAGLVAYLVGLGLVLNAMPHLYDAINAYNDGVLPPK